MDGLGPQCAGQTEYQSLDELPDRPPYPPTPAIASASPRPRPRRLLLYRPRTSRRMRTVSTVSILPCSSKPNATRRCHCYPACCCCFFLPHLTSPYLTLCLHVLTRLALCIRCRHWRLCSRFLPGHRRKQPSIALRTQPARGCFSGLQYTSTRSRNERNGHRDVYFTTVYRSLLLCLQPLRSILRPTNRPLRPLPIR